MTRAGERFEPALTEADRHHASVGVCDVAGSPPEIGSGHRRPLPHWPTPMNAIDHGTARTDHRVVHFTDDCRVFSRLVHIARAAPVVLQVVDTPLRVGF